MISHRYGGWSVTRSCGWLKAMLAAAGLMIFTVWLPCAALAQNPSPPVSAELVKSYLRLAEMYAEGRAVQRDLKKAVDYYRLAEMAGSDEARLALGTMALKGEGLPQDRTSALARIEPIAARGNIDALLLLADIYMGLYGGRSDPQRALAKLQLAADRGEIAAMLRIGDYYREGEVVAYDASKAVKAYKQAEALGSRTATVELALLQAVGEGMPRNAAAAMLRLQRLEAEGKMSALVAEGDLKLNGGAPAVDIAGAVDVWSEAAANGRIDAMLRLGDFYFYGVYGSTKFKKALSFYAAAAATGDKYGTLAFAKAQLARSKGVKDALKKLDTLTTMGFDEAGVVIADAYLRGHGVSQNPKKGLARLKKMAASGSKYANLRLIEIYRDGLSEGGHLLVRRNLPKARATLDAIAPSLGISELLYQQILLDAAAGATWTPSQLLERLNRLPVAMRQRLVKELRLAAPPLYVDLVRLKMQALGYLAPDKKGAKNLSKAVKSYCSSLGARKLCNGGTSAQLTAEVLQALF